MAEYRRFVAYVYEYQKGKKGRNCGFIQVEAREALCRMEVHILCPGLTPRVKCEIFGFVRNAGLMDGILLGSCVTEENRADCLVETERNNMGNSGLALEKIGGMILLTENGAFFGTEWDDQPIRPDNFRKVQLKKEESPEAVEKNEQESIQPEAAEEPVKQAEPESSHTDEEHLEEKASESFEMNREVLEERQETLKVKDEYPKQEKEQENSEPERAEAPGMGEEVLDKPEEPGIVQPEKPEADLTSQSMAEPAIPINQKLSQSPISFGNPVEAFLDGEICDCRKIQPRDLCHFQPRDCALRNNRFLQYGFYNFGHLIIGRNRAGQYILGVPGGYDQQERFMANMFGFPYFKESSQIRLPKTKGGYWYRLINPPKSH